MNIKAITRTAISIAIVYIILSFIANSINPSEWRTWERIVLALWVVGAISNHSNRDNIKIL